jgi:hypothetical protein
VDLEVKSTGECEYDMKVLEDDHGGVGLSEVFAKTLGVAEDDKVCLVLDNGSVGFHLHLEDELHSDDMLVGRSLNEDASAVSKKVLHLGVSHMAPLCMVRGCHSFSVAGWSVELVGDQVQVEVQNGGYTQLATECTPVFQ